jgi:hypothetical protein
MVAASIQVLVSAPHGTPAPADRITASSQGVLMEVMDAIQGALGSEDRQSKGLTTEESHPSRSWIRRCPFDPAGTTCIAVVGDSAMA